MPPEENDRLTEQQIKDTRTWIELGAVWTADERPQQTDLGDKTQVVTSGGLMPEWTERGYSREDFWAY